jgi:hypothetical protein
MSEEEKKRNEVSLALKTKRESLKEFFLQKQPYTHKDTFTDNQIVIDSNFIDDKKSASLTSNIEDKSIQEPRNENLSQESPETTKPGIVHDDISVGKPSSPANLELSPDEKRQKNAATRNMQRKNFLKLKRLQAMEQKSDEAVDMGVKESKTIEGNTEENSTLNGLNGDDKIESVTKSIEDIR